MSDFLSLSQAMAGGMTVKQVAEALGTAESTIRNLAKELFPESIQNGVATLFSTGQVHALKKNLVPRSLTLKSKVESATTDLEMKEKALEVFSWLTAERERLTARLAIAEPKAAYADEISNSEGGIPLSDFAHVLAGKGWEIGRTRLFRLLISSGILYESYLPNLKKKISRPYQTQIEAGRFLVHEVAVKAMNALYPQVLITPKGQKYVIDHLVEWEVKRLVRENGNREVVA